MRKNVIDRYLNDEELIRNINDECDNESMKILISRHENIVYSLINKFCNKNPSLSINDLMEDKFIIFQKAISTFDLNKNTKFSTFLYYVSYWHCLNVRSVKIKSSNFISCQDCDIELLNNSNNSHFASDNTIDTESNDYIFYILNKMKDKRINKIFKLRYLEEKNGKPTGWQIIANKLNLSMSRVIKLHEIGIKFVLNKINNDNINDNI